MSIEERISDYVQQQFQAFQLEEDDLGSDLAASSRVASGIGRHVHILVLNNGLDEDRNKNKNNNEPDPETDDNNNPIQQPSATTSAFLIPLLIKYTDAALCTEITADNRVAVRRVFHLIAAVACGLSSDNGEAIREVLDRAQLFSTVLSEKIRSQACILLGRVASHLGAVLTRHQKKNKSKDESESFRDGLAAIETFLVPRLTDKSQIVRQSAIQASGMWFGSRAATKDTTEDAPGAELLEGLLWSMWHDPSVANRAEAVQAVPIDSAETLDHVIARIHDVKEKVRVAAIDSLRLKVDPRNREIMTEEHFRDIARHGLTERCENTNLATTKLICTKWMKAAQFCPVELLRFMGVTTFEEECEKTLRVVVNTARTSGSARSNAILQELSEPEIRSFCSNLERSMIKLRDSSVTFDEYQLFYTRVACSSAKESSELTFAQKEDFMAKITPDIPTLCDLFQKHVYRFVESIHEDDEECMDQECFVCLQLLQLAKVSGLQEEGSRRHFANVMTGVLANAETPDDLIEECVESLRATYENEFDFFNAISLILANLTSAGSSGDSGSTDHTRVLFIFSVVLENAPSTLSTHDLFDVMTKIILSAVTNPNRTVREIGICCFGKLGLFSNPATILSEFKPILLEVAANEEEAVTCRGQALLGLCDWALLFSDILQPSNDSSSPGESLSLLRIVQETIQHKNTTLATIAAEVATKLLFSAKTSDNSVLAFLLVSFLDPNNYSEHSERNDEDVDVKDVGSPLRLQQLLSMFFPAFCLKSSECRSNLLDSIEKALELALDGSTTKKSKKRKAAYPLVKIVDYVSSIAGNGGIMSESHSSNETPGTSATADFDPVLSASLQVARFVTKNEQEMNVTQLRSLCKFLGNQDIQIENRETERLGKLKDCMYDLSFLEDSASLKALRPLIDLLSTVKGYEDNNDDEEEEDDDENDDEIFDHSYSDEETISEGSIDDETVPESITVGYDGRSTENKENPPSLVKTPRTNRRSSLQSNISVLGSIGSPNA
eukprot:jgi/Psemu1/260684/estExt_Genewise1Plus.C_4820028